MADIFLHIGSPKTATSSLQAVLSNNYERLLKQGVLYPKSFSHGDAHHVLVCDLLERFKKIHMADFWYGEASRGASWSLLKEELSSLPPNIKKVILSSELFFGQTRQVDKMLEYMASELSEHNVKVVVYLRRQDQLYSSFYNQDVKGVRQWSKGASEFYSTHQLFEKNYFEILELWVSHFGRGSIVVRPFDKGKLVGGDLIQDFLSVVGVSGLSGSTIEKNSGLGVNQLYVKQAMNKFGFSKELNDFVLEVILELISEAPASNALYVNKPAYAKLKKQWKADNNKLSSEYFLGGAVFSKDFLDEKELNNYTVNKTVIVGFIKGVARYIKKGVLRDNGSLFARGALYMLADLDLWGAVEQGTHSILLDAVYIAECDSTGK